VGVEGSQRLVVELSKQLITSRDSAMPCLYCRGTVQDATSGSFDLGPFTPALGLDSQAYCLTLMEVGQPTSYI
jgi:hypothetical protein